MIGLPSVIQRPCWERFSRETIFCLYHSAGGICMCSWLKGYLTKLADVTTQLEHNVNSYIPPWCKLGSPWVMHFPLSKVIWCIFGLELNSSYMKLLRKKTPAEFVLFPVSLLFDVLPISKAVLCKAKANILMVQLMMGILRSWSMQ